jgi:mRNA degradation ribonuclease J1/J2
VTFAKIKIKVIEVKHSCPSSVDIIKHKGMGLSRGI